tara:strand:- start:281 stop:595 length:315 start_codon:yes stop_codon:yes gene_type:complete
MGTKKQLTDSLKERLVDVAERGKVIGQALKVRADMAATRRRLRATYAELGEEVYGRLKAGELDGDVSLVTLQQQIDNFKADVREKEEELRQIMHLSFSSNGPGS